jgi:hypothetical protein
MIRTSHFAMTKHLETPVAISCGVPSWFKDAGHPVYAKLAPPWELVHGFKTKQLSEEDYRRVYHEIVLRPLDPLRTIAELLALGPSPTLLCWEASGFCHRRLAADWLAHAMGREIPEFTPGSYPLVQAVRLPSAESKKRPSVQLSLLGGW